MSKLLTRLFGLGIAGGLALVCAALFTAPASAAGLAAPSLSAVEAPVAQSVITNTVTLTMPVGVVDPVPGDNTATDSSTVTRQSDLAVGKTVATSGIAGTPITYTLVISNAGPSAATGALITDTLPTQVINATAR